MKRSELNLLIREAIRFVEGRGIPLPPFAHWTLKDWQSFDPACQEIVDNMLGWDITDFGSGDFYKVGLLIFTFRNGNFHKREQYPKMYAEKLLLVDKDQELPFHFHWSKMEDIINRGGGDLVMQVYNSKENGEFDDSDVHLAMDGRQVTVKAGGTVILKPGQSVTLRPGQYHCWKAVNDKVMLFEVSSTNDDNIDNRFHTAKGRFPTIEEDVAPEYLIFRDYPQFIKLRG
ncbi:MAG: D-lyxose/D-mannose family sugar isomerase [Clostridiales bacterium]|nr:D-lyxose/D-mannose family sugar isomerase [Clostridiales bacterium]